MKRNILLILSVFAAALIGFAAGCKEEKKPVLHMVTVATFPPYEFRRGTEIVGIDPEIIGEIARRNGYELRIEDMKFDSLITAIQTGKADIAASGITVTEERKRNINFTTAYVSARQVIIVPEKSGITGRNTLKGREIAVQHGTTGDTFVTKNIREPQRFENAPLAVAALNAGKVEAAVLDDAPAKILAAQTPGLKILPEPLTTEDYAFAVSKKRPELLEMCNRTLAEMAADGTLKAILDRYAGESDSAPAEHAEVSAWEKLKREFHSNFIAEKRYMYLLKGFLVTLEVSGAAVLLGVLIGFLVAVIRCTADQTGKFKIADLLCKLYLTVIRGTPVVVQLLIIYFVIFGSVNVDKVIVAILAFGLNSGAYVAEIIRSGIMSIDRGQMEAGRSLGLSYSRTMVLVILPQALKNVLPALGNEFIVLLKETSVAGYIALADLTKGGDIIRSQTYNAFMPLLAVALVYLAVVVLFSKLLGIVERRLKKNE